MELKRFWLIEICNDIEMQLLSLEEPWTLIIEDPLANSFVAPTTDVLEEDHQLRC